MKSMLVKFSNPKFDSLILLVNEIFAKSFSFILFWFLGIQLSKNELSEFLLEMPFIFLFSTVLSFGVATFFLEQKKSDTDTFKKQTTFALGLVLIINLIIVTALCICFFLNFISINYLIVFLVAVSLNINMILSEYFFVLKKYRRMVLTSITPKLLFFTGLLFLDEYYSINKNFVYLIMIFTHIVSSLHIIFNINIKFTINDVIKYFQFAWILTLQYFLAYLAYVSFRYFINISDDSNYLIEFSILQTYMGFFALLVSVANRFLIHDLYESLIANSVNKVITYKFSLFNKLFLLMSFLYLNIVVYYSTVKLDVGITLTLFVGMFFIIIASLLNFIAQYYKSIIIFDKKFAFILYVNLFSSFITLILSYLSLISKINVLYSFSILIVNLILFLFYRSKVELSFFNKLISPNFIYKMMLLLSVFLLLEYFVYTFNFFVIPINSLILFFIALDLINYLLKSKLLDWS
tara:strand:- start:311 stop:1702 length:1392 start_codon:yes stop_codon:yes gene_type:complete